MQILQGLFHIADDAVDRRIALCFLGIQCSRDLLVRLRVQMLHGDVFHLHLHRIDPKAARQRCVDVERLTAFLADLLLAHVVDGPQIVEPVGELDDENADVLAHRQEHPAQVLRLPLLFAFELQGSQFGDTLDEQRHFFPEVVLHIFFSIGSIFDDIVQQTAHDGHLVHAEFCQDLRHRDGMDQIRLAGLSELPFMHLFGHIKSLPDAFHIVERIELLESFQEFGF